jgi:hypothetical protein
MSSTTVSPNRLHLTLVVIAVLAIMLLIGVYVAIGRKPTLREPF